MKTNNRMTRINDEILRELSQILMTEVKDPRLGVMTSILRVDTTQDLKYCKVYVSVLGNEEEKKGVMEGLKNAGGFIRHLIAERVNLRNTPEFIFKLDDSVEYGIRMSKLIDEVSKGLSDKSGEENEQ